MQFQIEIKRLDSNCKSKSSAGSDRRNMKTNPPINHRNKPKAMKTKVITIAIIIALIPTFIYSNNLPNGLIFRVIVENMDAKLDASEFEKYQPINFKEEDQLFTYEVGAFKDFIRAQKAKNEVKANGYQKADLVAYFNNKPVSLDDAFVLLDNQNHIDQKGGFGFTEQQIDDLLSAVEKPDFYYTVQIGVFNTQQVNNFFDLPKTINERVTNKGNFRYAYGHYYTIHDAKAALGFMKDSGMNNAFITAYDDDERIPLARAISMEKKFLSESLASQ
jgi:hypothetical protein